MFSVRLGFVRKKTVKTCLRFMCYLRVSKHFIKSMHMYASFNALLNADFIHAAPTNPFH